MSFCWRSCCGARGFLVPDRVLWSRLLRMLAAACVMAAVLWRLRKILVPASGVAVSIPSLVLLVAAGLASYGAAATALGLHRLRKEYKK